MTTISINRSHVPLSQGEDPREDGRRLLLVSYHFPPSREVGARRWQQFARLAVEQQWTLDVVALDPADLEAPDWSSLDQLPVDVRVYRVPQPTLPLDRLVRRALALRRRLRARRAAKPDVSAPSAAAPRPESLSRRELRGPFHSLRDAVRAFHAWRHYAHYQAWARRAATLARQLVERTRYRGVITSGPPHMVHEVGWRLWRNTGLPFVVDLRDPWSLAPRADESGASSLWFHWARRDEQRLVRAASLIVVNTEPAERTMQAAYPVASDRIIGILNGYDDEPTPPARRGRCFVIAHAGSLYLDRDPRPLLRAAARVIHDLGLTPGLFRVEFMGAEASYGGTMLARMADEEHIGGFVHVHAARPRPEAMEFLAGATMLVSLPLVSSAQDVDESVPAKVFEYARFDAWLLALARPGSATELLLRGTGADVVAPDDVDAMAAVLRARYLAYASGARPEGPRLPDYYSRRAQAHRLFDEIERRLPRLSGTPRPAG